MDTLLCFTNITPITKKKKKKISHQYIVVINKTKYKIIITLQIIQQIFK